MKKTLLLLLLLPLHLFAQTFAPKEVKRWEKQAARATIVRDNWGIPHIYGKTDADAVFGLLYAQCEDDFRRVEMNYIEKLGRMAEVKGESALADDLLIRLVIDSSEAIADYKKAPRWLKKLLDAQADAVNFFLYKHPEVRPALLPRFQPWFNLLWTDGSIGAISTADISTGELAQFYLKNSATGSTQPHRHEEILTGSNGFAFAPSITASGRAILYINPHVTFYFRPEAHVVSEEGLNVYGAVTWGQFFVYQGFNEHCGWMHTSSYTDISDTYAEKITRRGERYFYEYDGAQRPVQEKKIRLRYRAADGKMVEKNVVTLFTHHGPIMAERAGQWLSMKAVNRSMASLIQSWERTKSVSFADYKQHMNLLANASNNTVYADAEGNIAYWHGNFQPRRDAKLDWSQAVDGSTSATEWRGLHPVEESVHCYNPPNGWLQNCNSTPFTVAGQHSPRRENFPKYMAPDGENFRGINAARTLSEQKNYTLEKVIAAGYDTRLAAFEVLVPALVRAFEENVRPADSLFAALREPIALLKTWDFRCNTRSVPTTLAIEWGQRLLPAIQKQDLASVFDDEADQVEKTQYFAAHAPADAMLLPLRDALRDLEKRFGHWQVEWGEINRFQRISGAIDQKFDDAQPSLPIGFAASVWGALPSYTAKYFPGTKKRYGVNGNSFVCAVEFGEKIRAKSLLAGGESSDPASPHFADQLEMYAQGRFKDVLFYREDVLKHAERTYHPGE